MTVPRLGRVQLMMMHILWERGTATAREITDALNEIEPIAHSTVQTLLRKLEAKGAVGHEVDDRTFVFRPLVESDQVRKKATREVVDRLFGGSPAGLVSYLLRHEHIDTGELTEIQRLVSDPEAGHGTRSRLEKGK